MPLCATGCMKAGATHRPPLVAGPALAVPADHALRPTGRRGTYACTDATAKSCQVTMPGRLFGAAACAVGAIGASNRLLTP